MTTKTITSMTLLFIAAMMFLSPPQYKVFVALGFSFAIFLAIGLSRDHLIARTKIDRKLLFCLLALGLCVLASIVVSMYSSRDLLIDTCFIVLVAFVFTYSDEADISTWITDKIFYILAILSALTAMYIHVATGSLYFVFGSYDKNYFGLVLFLLFCWCWFKQRKIGVLACIGISLFLNSRGYQLMIALFIVSGAFVWLIDKKNMRKQGNCAGVNKPAKAWQIFIAFLVMLAAIVAFSSWWSNSIVGSGTISSSVVSRGFNDSSNAIRFNSNIYAFQQLMSDPLLILRGYDADILSAMNIGNPLDDASNMQYSASMNGYRIVQPHHFVLNLLLKHGAIYSVVYLILLSIIVSPYIKKSTLGVWLPLAATAMIMHSTLTAQYLLFTMVVLSIASVSYEKYGARCLVPSWLAGAQNEDPSSQKKGRRDHPNENNNCETTAAIVRRNC